MSEPMMAQIMAFGGNFAPRNWQLCWGQLIAVTDASAVYSILGTYYGGDGRVSFALPDLRGRAPVGMGSGPGRTPRQVGQYGGYEQVNLAAAQMPTHTHTIDETEFTGDVAAQLHYNNETDANSNDPNGSYLAKTKSTVKAYNNTGTKGDMAADAISVTNNLEVSVTLGEAGGSLAHENMQPWLCLSYIIAMEGYYPSRS